MFVNYLLVLLSVRIFQQLQGINNYSRTKLDKDATLQLKKVGTI